MAGQPSSPPESGRRRWLLVGVVLLLWGGISLLRLESGSMEEGALGDHLWDITVQVQAIDLPEDGTVQLAVPSSTRYLKVVGKTVSHPGWRQKLVQASTAERRRVLRFSPTRVGRQELSSTYTVHQLAAPTLDATVVPKGLSAESRERYLQNEPLLALEDEMVLLEANQLAEKTESDEEVLNRIFHRARQLLKTGNPAIRSVPEVLTAGRASAIEKAYVMVAFARALNIPARLVTGLVLQERQDVPLHHWVEFYEEGRGWVPFDPHLGYFRELPHNHLAVVRDREAVVEFSQQSPSSVVINVTNVDQLLGALNPYEASWQDLFNLQRLSLDTRNTLAILLLLPLAVLGSTVFRELVGVKSFGTFTPTLFALALSHTEWQTAAVVLALVLGLGVLGRSTIQIKLRRLPRLTIVLVLVALSVSFSVSVMEYLQWEPEGEVVLLPIVILAMLVDRIYTTLDNEGLHNAGMRLMWTLLQAVFICLPILQLEALGHYLVSHPEHHLLSLAAVLLLSAYSGKTLIEKPGFGWLACPATRNPKKKEGKEGGDDL